jgi:hypothetical protein
MSDNLPFIERDINEVTYKAYTLTLDHWAALTEHLTSVIGDPIASVLSGDIAMPEGMNPSFGRMDIAAIISGIVTKLTAQKIMALVKHMGKSLHADGAPLGSEKQKMWWPKRMRDLAPVVGLFLEAQYSAFSEGLSDSLPTTESSEKDPLEKASG